MKYELKHSDSIQLYQGDSVKFEVEHNVSWGQALRCVLGLKHHVTSPVKLDVDRIYISAGGHPTVILKVDDTSGPGNTYIQDNGS
jgi:hypothetical protein